MLPSENVRLIPQMKGRVVCVNGLPRDGVVDGERRSMRSFVGGGVSHLRGFCGCNLSRTN